VGRFFIIQIKQLTIEQLSDQIVKMPAIPVNKAQQVLNVVTGFVKQNFLQLEDKLILY
jgi:hypothetical protein